MSGRSLASWIFAAIGVAGAGFGIAFVAVNWGYYSLSSAERVLQSSHERLRSSGSVGLVCGIVGTTLMLLNLSYLLRKRLAVLATLGTLRTWMSFHVLTGLAAAGLIVVHSAFRPTSTIATLALGALGVVVATGLVGRYLYARVPRSLEGRELELDEIRRALERDRDELESLGVDTVVFQAKEPAAAVASRRGVASAVPVLLFGDRDARERFADARRSLEASPSTPAARLRIGVLLERFQREHHWLVRHHELRALMRSWRFLHRWLAILMLLLATFHVVIALRYGSLWIFGGVR